MKTEFRKYLAYAIGELLLVIIGILIALQIDNWNEDRKERATLQAYVESIARNMREDLLELEPLIEHRSETLLANAMYGTLFNRSRYEVDEIFFLSQVMLLNTIQPFFSANTSGFEALKVSGVLDRLQGSGLEQLLSRYHATVNQISRLEQNMIDTIRPISIEMRRERSRDLESYAILNPSALLPERFNEVQPLYNEIVHSPNTSALLEAGFPMQRVLLHYESLKVLGEAFVRAVEAGHLTTSEAGVRTPFDAFKVGLGLPILIDNGRPAVMGFWQNVSQSGELGLVRFDAVRQEDNALLIDSPGGMDWVAFYWNVINPGARIGRANSDFSRFRHLVLEMKGQHGGELVNVHVKDARYPDYLAPIGVDLTLTDEWHTYEIDLAEFAPTDFSTLHVPLGFLMTPATEPQAIYVRNAYYR